MEDNKAYALFPIMYNLNKNEQLMLQQKKILVGDGAFFMQVHYLTKEEEKEINKGA